MRQPSNAELPVIQRGDDLILWYVPIFNRLPRDHRFALGDRLIAGLYDLLKQLITARYTPRAAKPSLLGEFDLVVTPLRGVTPWCCVLREPPARGAARRGAERG